MELTMELTMAVVVEVVSLLLVWHLPFPPHDFST